MAETSGELKARVVTARNRLDNDINSLQYQVKSTLDWRAWFVRHPWTILGPACIGAMVLSYTLSKVLFDGRRTG
jgi:hypothetical protein